MTTIYSFADLAIIFILECCLIFFQVLFTLRNNADQKSIRFLTLLLLIFQFNLLATLQHTNLALKADTIFPIIIYGSGFIMALNYLRYLEWSIGIDYYESFLRKKYLPHLASLFVLLFVIPLILTGDLLLSNRLLLIPAAIYCLRLVIGLTKQINIICPVVREYNPKTYIELIATYLGAISWLVVAFVLFFNGIDLQTLKGINVGFFFLSCAYLVTVIREGRAEKYFMRQQQERLLTLSTRFEKTNSIIRQLHEHFFDLHYTDRRLAPDLELYLKDQLNTIRQWEDLEVSLTLTDQDIYRQLHHNHPQLNEKEIRHLCMIKGNYDTDQIARILEVKKNTLRNSRSLLKKKLKIGNQSLKEYLDHY